MVDANGGASGRKSTGKLARVRFVVWIFVLATVVFLLANLVAGLPYLFDANPVVQFVAADALFGVTLVAGSLAYLVLTGRGIGFLDVRVPGLGTAAIVLLATGAGLLFNFGMDAVQAALGLPVVSSTTAILDEAGTTTVFLGGIVTSILFIGPGEEVLNRGIVQKRLYDAFSKRVTVVIASVPFVLWHVPVLYLTSPDLTGVTASLAYMFGASLIIGWVYLRTENLVAPALVHGLNDAFVYGYLYLTVTPRAF